MNIKELQKSVHALAKSKGWYEGRNLSSDDCSLSMLALIHSEISEALECIRDGDLALRIVPISGKPEGLPSELADVVIRCLDYAEAYGIVGLDEAYAYGMAEPITKTGRPTPERGGHLLYLMHGELHADGSADLRAVVGFCCMVARAYDLDLSNAIETKHAFNATRQHRHGGRAL